MDVNVIIWLRTNLGSDAAAFTRSGELPKGTRFVLLQVIHAGGSEWTPGTRYVTKDAVALVERAIAQGLAPGNGYRLVPAPPRELDQSTIDRLKQLAENRKRQRKAEESDAE